MTQQEGSKTTSREVQVGETFRPFEGMNFPDIRLDQEELLSLLESPFRVKGINGILRMTTDPKAMFSNDEIVTPLGSVKSVWKIDGNERRVTQVPLSPDIQFFLRETTQLDFLDDYALEFQLGDDSYYIIFGRDDNDVNERDFIGDEDVEAGYYDCIDSRGDDVTLELPYDIERIRQIQVRIVERESIPVLDKFWKR